MKTLEDIDKAFREEIQRNTAVRLWLKRDIEAKKNILEKEIIIKPVEKLRFGMPQHELIGIFKDYWKDEPDEHCTTLEFKDLDGYRFILETYQIDSYIILEESE